MRWLALVLAMMLAGCVAEEKAVTNYTKPVDNITAEIKAIESGCGDADCIILRANNCEDIDATINQSGGEFRYVAYGCVLNKTVVALDDGNPLGVRNSFEGSSMTCAYPKSKFFDGWVNSLVSGLEFCKGDLKHKIGWLLVSE